MRWREPPAEGRGRTVVQRESVREGEIQERETDKEGDVEERKSKRAKNEERGSKQRGRLKREIVGIKEKESEMRGNGEWFMENNPRSRH